MGGWYTVGLVVGLGVAAGVLLIGLFGGRRAGALAAAIAAAAVGVVVGLLVGDWPEAIGGGLGGAAGSLGAAPAVVGALRRGGTKGATAVLVAGGALLLALVALIPFVGYFEAVGIPALGARLRRRAARTFAGLRILARD